MAAKNEHNRVRSMSAASIESHHKNPLSKSKHGMLNDGDIDDHNLNSKHRESEPRSLRKKKSNERDRLLSGFRGRVTSNNRRLSFEVSQASASNGSGAYDDASTLLYEQIVEERTMSSNPSQFYALRSYRRYTKYNGIKFIIISIVVIIIATWRQMQLFNHYTESICNGCCEAARAHPDEIFEWQTCNYHNGTACDTKKVHNLSIHYDLFSSSYYYIITAIIVLIIAILYATVSNYISHKTNDVDDLLSKLPLEFVLTYNIKLSMICFYQIAIDYQYYLRQDPFPIKFCYIQSTVPCDMTKTKSPNIKGFLFIYTVMENL